MNDREVYDARLTLVDFPIEVFQDVPDEAFVERLLAGELALPDDSVNDRLDTGFGYVREFVAANEGRDPATVADELAGEYSRLFTAPRPPVLPHETHYREDTEFIGEGLAEVEASYSAAGWAPPEGFPEENDFLAVELAFVRNLIERQRAGHAETFGFERVFLDEHLLRWHEAFLVDITDETDEPFYLAGAHVFAGFVDFEDELVAQMVADR